MSCGRRPDRWACPQGWAVPPGGSMGRVASPMDGMAGPDGGLFDRGLPSVGRGGGNLLTGLCVHPRDTPGRPPLVLSRSTFPPSSSNHSRSDFFRTARPRRRRSRAPAVSQRHPPNHPQPGGRCRHRGSGIRSQSPSWWRAIAGSRRGLACRDADGGQVAVTGDAGPLCTGPVGSTGRRRSRPLHSLSRRRCWDIANTDSHEYRSVLAG